MKPCSDLAAGLDEAAVFLLRFVVMSDEQAATVALFGFHTHTIDAFDYTPYLFVNSPERESGKSRLKEAVELLVANPVPTSNVSPAALFRIAEETPPPTFLVDEVDEIFALKSDRSELRGLLNAGFHRGDHAIRMVGEGSRMEPKKFRVFCPKLLVGKNTAALGDTLESRCLRITLKRKMRGETVERFRRREAGEQATPLFDAFRSLASFHVDELAAARPDLPGELRDREQDIWEPLLAIADRAGGDWPARARAAAVALSMGAESDEPLGVQLLADCRQVLNGDERVSTARLIELLVGLEEQPWMEKWWDAFKGEPRPGAARNLAWHLQRYGIRSETLRLDDGERLKGYRREQFEDAWRRYLPPSPAPTRDIRDNAHGDRDCGPSATRDITPSVTDREESPNPHKQTDVTDVTEATGEGGNGLPAGERKKAVLRDEVARKRMRLREEAQAAEAVLAEVGRQRHEQGDGMFADDPALVDGAAHEELDGRVRDEIDRLDALGEEMGF